MELNNLKEIWKELDQEIVQQRNSGQIAAILKKRSRSPIARMKRNLLLEFILVVVLYGCSSLYYFIAFNSRLAEISWFMIVTGLFFIIYYARKNKLLNEMQCVSCQVRSNLEKQISTLEKYIRFYLITGTLLPPVSVIFLGILLTIKMPNPLKSTIFYVSPSNPLWRVMMVWIIALIVITTLMYFCNVWYVKKLYGKHIQELKMILREMKEE